VRHNHQVLLSASLLLLLPGILPSQTQTKGKLQAFTMDHRRAFLSHSSVDVSFLLDAPAGRHGFVRAQNGHLVRGDGERIRFWGVNITDWSKGSVMVPAKQDASLWAATLARFGVNCVRLQFLDLPAPRGLIDGTRDDTLAFDIDQLDREDFFIAELKKRGIYIDLNLLVGRPFKAGDGVHDYEKIREGAKGISLFDDRLIELQKDYANKLLTHYNPYTKSQYRGEPAIAIVEINNENALWIGAHGPTPYYDRELADLYNRWLRENLRPADLRKLQATAGVTGDEPVPSLFGKAEIEAAPKDRFYGEAEFFVAIEKHYFEDMRKYLTDTLDVKSLVLATADHSHSGSSYPLLLATSSFDIIDGHTYWQPPWASTSKSPMVNDPENSTVVELSRTAVQGKPYIVSEVNHPFPSESEAEGIPILAAYGGLQDWDGIFWYTFEPKVSPDWKPYIGDPFDLSLDPVRMTELAAGALCFLRSDAKPALKIIGRSYSRDQVFDSARLLETERPYFTPGFPLLTPLQHGSRIESLEGVPTRGFSQPTVVNPVVSDTRQLVWYKSGERTALVTLDSPRSQALVGYVTASARSVTNLSVDLENEFAAIVLTSMEPKPISSASRLLLVAAGRVENHGMQWNLTRSNLSNWGGSPTLIENIAGRVILKGLHGAEDVSVQPLDGSGQPFGEAIRASKTMEGWAFRLGPVPTTWYEVTVIH